MPHIAPEGPAEPDRINADVMIKTMILDRNDGVLQVRRDLVQRHVAPLLVHAEPRPPVGRVEPRVANAATQLVHRPPLSHGPDDENRRRGDEAGE